LGREASTGEDHRSKPQKILLIDLGDRFGGVENYLLGLTRLLKVEGDLYALCVLPELAQRLQKLGVRTVLIPAFRGPLKPLRFFIAWIILPVLLVMHRIQTVQVNGFLEATLMLPARLLGRRAVYTRHGPFELEDCRWYRNPLRFLPRALARISVHLATEVVCVSETVGAEVRKIRPPVPVSVIPNWIPDQPADQPPPHPPQPGSSELMLLCASRLERYKGIQLVIEAMRGLEGLRLTVVGDGSYRAELEALAAGLPVEFAGFQNDVQPYYEAADIFLMPSLGPEGMPVSSLEAMGRGLPCIFSDLPVHREITDDGQGALLFRSGDADSLRRSLQALANNAELRGKIAAAAYRIVQERYTEKTVRQAYVRVFRVA
jgi:glycosyltransferase involved in cell wall biosynthesis